MHLAAMRLIMESDLRGLKPPVLMIQRLVALGTAAQKTPAGGGSGGGGAGPGHLLSFASVLDLTVLTQFIGMLKSSTSAFDPSAVMMLDHALTDVSAVIGSALSPVLRVTTDVVRAFSDALLPVMNDLAPILSEVAAVVGQVLMPVFGALSSALRPVIAVFSILLPPLQMLGDFAKFASVIFSGFMTAISEAFSAMFNWKGVGAVVDNARTGFQKFTAAVIVAAGTLAKLLGANSFLRGMIDSLGANKGASFNIQAVKNAQVTDAMSFNRQLATNAAMASMAPDAMSGEDKWRADVLKQLISVQDGSSNSLKELASLARAIKEAMGWGKWLDRVNPFSQDSAIGLARGMPARDASDEEKVKWARAFFERNNMKADF